MSCRIHILKQSRRKNEPFIESDIIKLDDPDAVLKEWEFITSEFPLGVEITFEKSSGYRSFSSLAEYISFLTYPGEGHLIEYVFLWIRNDGPDEEVGNGHWTLISLNSHGWEAELCRLLGGNREEIAAYAAAAKMDPSQWVDVKPRPEPPPQSSVFERLLSGLDNISIDIDKRLITATDRDTNDLLSWSLEGGAFWNFVCKRETELGHKRALCEMPLEGYLMQFERYRYREIWEQRFNEVPDEELTIADNEI